MQPRGRHVLDAELPDVRHALAAAGALRVDPLDAHAAHDHRPRAARRATSGFVTFTARRTDARAA